MKNERPASCCCMRPREGEGGEKVRSKLLN